MSKGYYQNSVCALVVYDITSRKTFNNVQEWIKQCKKYGAKTEMIVLIGNKTDLENEREVKKEEGEEFAEKNEMRFFETSALNGSNIQNIFQDTAKIILDNINNDFYDLSTDECGIKVKREIKYIPPNDIHDIKKRGGEEERGGDNACSCNCF